MIDHRSSSNTIRRGTAIPDLAEYTSHLALLYLAIGLGPVARSLEPPHQDHRKVLSIKTLFVQFNHSFLHVLSPKCILPGAWNTSERIYLATAVSC